MEYKHSLGSWIPTLAGKRFVCTKEVVFDVDCGVKVNSTGNVPTFVLILEPAINNGKTGYLGRVPPIDEVFELMIMSTGWYLNC